MPVEVNQIIRSKRKTLAIQIKNDGSVIVRVPLRTPDRAIDEFVEQHSAWVERKQAQIRSAIPQRTRQYIPGEMFFLLGNEYPLEIIKNQKESLVLDGCFQLAEPSRDRAKDVFERWYRAQAKAILQERVDFYARKYGFRYQGIKITGAKTRWGSCSGRGSLSFSWRLILTPLEVVDYVVVHELVHTIHHNHSKRFWKKLETILPDFKEHRTWLRKHGMQFMV